MKKVININFQGTIVPIEESAYEILQKYSESLRRHFASEEGRDEIINDIETRISELFSETLKNGATCITDDDVNAVINSMGRPEDFDADLDIHTDAGNAQKQNFAETASSNYTHTQTNTHASATGKRLYRDENHKILGGVCSGLANYFNVDPVVIRIVALIFFSVALIPYIVIWIAVPSSASQVIGSPRKRLFRDTDNKMIAGVCTGLAQYFGVHVWIPRIIFLIPFISIAFRINHWFGWGFPHFLSLSFSPAATISYIILWILVPEAKTTSDKLEMQGKAVDLNSIKDTVQNDINEFKDKAQKWSKEVSGTAKKWGEDISNAAQTLTKKNNGDNAANSGTASNATAGNATATNYTEADYNTQQPFSSVPPKRERKSGVPPVLKIFGYIVLGLVITPIILSLFGVGIGFMAVLPATDFILKSGWETVLAWGTFFLFIWVPIIGIILWFFRLITRSRKGSAAIRGTFITLWILGWICFFGLLSMIGHDFSRSAFIMPSSFAYQDKGVKTMVVTAHPKDVYSDWNMDDFDDFLRYFGNDSIRIPNVALRIDASKDDNYHIESVAYANGASKQEASGLASKIVYGFDQKDSLLYIPTEFFINRNDKFRNQRLMVKIFVPIGKQIIVKGEASIRHNIDMNFGPFGVHRNNWENADYNYWDYDIVYVMTAEGLKPANGTDKEKNKDDNKSTENKEKKEKTTHTDNEESSDNNDGDQDTPKASTTVTKTSTGKKFTFYSMASLLSDKFSL